MKSLKARATEQGNIIGIGITVVAVMLVAAFVNIHELKTFVAASGALAPFLVILLKASTIVFAPLSGAPIYPLVGLLFGFWPGVAYVIIGDFLGVTIAFHISRWFGYPLVNRLISGKERGTLAKMVKHIGTTKGFLRMCLASFALPELIAYGSGLSTLPYWKLVVIYMPISIAVSCAAVLFGSLLDPSSSSLFVTIGVPLAGVVVVAAGIGLFMKGVREEA